MPWFAYAALTAEDADAVAYYLKNVLPAVKNEIPAPSLNEGFEEMAPEVQDQLPAGASRAALSPVILVVAGVAIILLVSVAVAVLRRRSA
jgi:hypothetical protein